MTPGLTKPLRQAWPAFSQSLDLNQRRAHQAIVLLIPEYPGSRVKPGRSFIGALREHHYALATFALQLARNLFGVSTALIGSYVDAIESVAALRRLLGIGAEVLASKLPGEPVGLLRRAKSRDVNDESGILVIFSGVRRGRRLWLGITALSIRT